MSAISIIVPVHNVEAYLPQCLDSIRSQTFSDFEIVCVVDGGSDRSEDILNLYKYVEPRLQIIVKENGGLSSARNRGMEVATGEVFMFVDADDLLAPDACQIVYETFKQTRAEVFTFGAWCYPQYEETPWHKENLTPSDRYYGSFSTDILFREQSHPFVWRTAIKSELIERTHLQFDESILFGEDQVFHFALYPKARGVVFSSRKLYHYRLRREGSLMASRFADPLLRLREHIKIADRICSNWLSDGLMKEHGSELALWICDFLLPYCLREERDNRLELTGALRCLFTRYYSVEAFHFLDESNPLKQVCLDLVEASNCGDLPDVVREAYLNGKAQCENGNHESDLRTGFRSNARTKLRGILPMTAEGLEYRLKNLELLMQEKYEEGVSRVIESDLMSAERSRWVAFESGSLARSLALLNCELLLKKMQDKGE